MILATKAPRLFINLYFISLVSSRIGSPHLDSSEFSSRVCSGVLSRLHESFNVP